MVDAVIGRRHLSTAVELTTGLGDFFGLANGDAAGVGVANNAEGDGDADGELWAAVPPLAPPHAVAIKTSRQTICAFLIEPPTAVTLMRWNSYGRRLILAAMYRPSCDQCASIE